jgi:hypothetical protein
MTNSERSGFVMVWLEKTAGWDLEVGSSRIPITD